MSNNKQSSVELFIEQLEEKGNAYEENEGGRTINISIDISDYMELKIQAKAMHKEEITKAFDEGQEYEYQYHINSTPKFDSETYYNETFGGEDE